MEKTFLWGIILFCLCIVLISVSSLHEDSTAGRKIKQVWHGRIFWENSVKKDNLRTAASSNGHKQNKNVCNSYVYGSTTGHSLHVCFEQVVISNKSIKYIFPNDIKLWSGIVYGIVSGGMNGKLKRQHIRDTWCKGQQCLFVVYGPFEGIRDEYEKNADMLWLDIDDSSDDTYIIPYQSQVFMHVMNTQVSKLTYAFKTYDDYYVSTSKIEEELFTKRPEYWGKVHYSAQVERNPLSQWFLTKEQYSPETYPDYCGSLAYAMSKSFLSCASSNLNTLEFMPWEDVASGILAQKCNVKPVDSTGKFMKSVVISYKQKKTEEKKAKQQQEEEDKKGEEEQAKKVVENKHYNSEMQHANLEKINNAHFKKSNLLFTSAGDLSNVNQWAIHSRKYDIIVVYYGEREIFEYEDDVDLVLYHKGVKFENLKWFLQHADVSHYDNIAVFDDDIEITTNDMNRLFEVPNKYGNVKIWGPTFSKYTPERGWYNSLMTLKNSEIRYVEFIEMGTVLFTRQQILNFMDVFDTSLKGWGTDTWFSYLCNQDKFCNIALMDNIDAHAPLIRIDGTREIDKVQSMEKQHNRWVELSKKRSIPPKVPRSAMKMYFDIPKIRRHDKIIRDPMKTPLVVEQYNLILFIIPGNNNSFVIELVQKLMQNAELKYLSDYTDEAATYMMTDDTWTRAVFLRHPYERLLNIYLTKYDYILSKCGNEEFAFPEFVSLLDTCSDPLWSPQEYSIDHKWWKYINFKGRMKDIDKYVNKLLKKLNITGYNSESWPGGHVYGKYGYENAMNDWPKFYDYNLKVKVGGLFQADLELYSPEQKSSTSSKVAILPECSIVADCVATTDIIYEGEGIFQTLWRNEKKVIGGDEFWIGNPDTGIVLQTIDLQNGKYKLLCESPSDSFETFDVWLQYTCGMGMVEPPAKRNCANSGAVNKKFSLEAKCVSQGYVATDTSKIKLSNKLYVMGGTLLHDFVRRAGVARYDNTQSVEIDINLDLDTLSLYFTRILRQVLPKNEEGWLMLGCDGLDLLIEKQDVHFENHRNGMIQLFEMLAKEYPKLRILWKGLNAVHSHLLKCEHDRNTASCLAQHKYMSSGRAKVLRDVEKQVCEDTGVFYIDLYDFSYENAKMLRANDGIRYTDAANDMMWNIQFE